MEVLGGRTNIKFLWFDEFCGLLMVPQCTCTRRKGQKPLDKQDVDNAYFHIVSMLEGYWGLALNVSLRVWNCLVSTSC